MAIDFFNFEDKKYDIPFYNNNPKISKFAWLILWIAMVIGYLSHLTVDSYIGIPFEGIMLCFILLIPVLYYLNWDYKAIFRKPSLNDLMWAVGMALTFVVYSTACTYLFSFAGINEGKIPLLAVNLANDFASFIFLLMGEELIKFILFAFFLCILYKFSSNRKPSIVVSMFITVMIFGLIHAIPTGFYVTGFLVQGLGSLVHMFLYVKTKNVFVCYISHILTDTIISIITLFAV